MCWCMWCVCVGCVLGKGVLSVCVCWECGAGLFSEVIFRREQLQSWGADGTDERTYL